MGATIKDIAKMANVSVSTVSRVINNNYPVSSEIRERVERIMQESQYRPNAVARSLRSNKTHMVALIIPELSNLFFTRAVEGIERELTKCGYSCAIASSERNKEKEIELIEMFLERRIDGLIIAPADLSGESIKYCINSGVQVVLFDRNIPELKKNKVLWNNIKGAYSLTKHLIEKGHQKIAVINVSLENANGKDRLEGYRQALTEAGIVERKEYITKSNFCEEDAYMSAKALFQLPDPPSAVFCANEIVLNGTLSALQDLELKVYEDVSVVAFGSCECNRFITTKITTVEQDCMEMGKQAGNLLKHILNQEYEENSVIVLDTKLVKRDSVKTI